jgi:hypothetical protein
MISVFTATNERCDILPVWCSALRCTLRDSYKAHVYHVAAKPYVCGQSSSRIPDWNIGVPLNCVMSEMPQFGKRMFLEEDVIPVLPWSPADYTNGWAMMEASPGLLWPSISIAMQDGSTLGPPADVVPIPQRFVRDGGCPDWLPPELCQLALAANAKVVGRHFLHLDKMSRGAPEMEQKNALLQMLAERFSKAERPASFAPPAEPASVSYQPTRPGTELKKLLATIGITATPNCSCNARARTMDANEAREPGWCERNLDTVVGWLREEATKRRLPFLDAAGRLLVRRAIRNARKAAS